MNYVQIGDHAEKGPGLWMPGGGLGAESRTWFSGMRKIAITARSLAFDLIYGAINPLGLMSCGAAAARLAEVLQIMVCSRDNFFY